MSDIPTTLKQRQSFRYNGTEPVTAFHRAIYQGDTIDLWPGQAAVLQDIYPGLFVPVRPWDEPSAEEAVISETVEITDTGDGETEAEASTEVEEPPAPKPTRRSRSKSKRAADPEPAETDTAGEG